MSPRDANDDGRRMAGYYMSLMEGDTHQVEDAFEFMRERGWIDENDELIDDEAE